MGVLESSSPVPQWYGCSYLFLITIVSTLVEFEVDFSCLVAQLCYCCQDQSEKNM